MIISLFYLEKPQSKGGGNQREQGEKWSCLLQERRPIRLHLRFVCSMLMYISNTYYVHNFLEYQIASNPL